MLGEEAFVPFTNDQPVAGSIVHWFDVGLLVDVLAKVTVLLAVTVPGQPRKSACGAAPVAVITTQPAEFLVSLPAEFVAVRATVKVPLEVKVICGLAEFAFVPPANDQPVAGVTFQVYDVGELLDVLLNVTVLLVAKLPQPEKLAIGATVPAVTATQLVDVVLWLPAEFVAVNAMV